MRVMQRLALLEDRKPGRQEQHTVPRSNAHSSLTCFWPIHPTNTSLPAQPSSTTASPVTEGEMVPTASRRLAEEEASHQGPGQGQEERAGEHSKGKGEEIIQMGRKVFISVISYISL